MTETEETLFRRDMDRRRAIWREIAAIDAQRRRDRWIVGLAFAAILVACAVAWWRS